MANEATPLTDGDSADPKQDRSESTQRLDSAVQSTSETLLEIKTLFPFLRESATVRIDREKITIYYSFFIKIGEIVSIQLDDVSAVVAYVGPLFGSVKIFSRPSVLEDHPNNIRYLRRQDALQLKRLLEGYIIANQRGIDVSVLSREEVVGKLMALGAGLIDER